APVCLELRKIGIALARVMKDFETSNEYWKVSFFIQIVYQMAIAVLCLYFSIHAHNELELWLFAATICACWVSIAFIWFIGLQANSEISKIRRIILDHQHRVHERHRFLAFKICSIVSTSNIGYSMLDFFQITKRSALILLGWFGSAIVLMLTYFEQNGITQFLLAAKRKDLFASHA
ncbi:hypothetical protein GZH46_01726, partial [Fragariocoptes setiger]